MESNKIYYAKVSDGNSVDHQDYNDYLSNAENRLDMPGFDADYKDVVDYILKITHRIWEEKGVGVIYDTYHNDVAVHSCSTHSVGIKSVITGTLENLHGFPDRRLVGEEVVWSEDRPGHFFSSHRILSLATNMGDSLFGKATGKSVRYLGIADCVMKNNRIYEEWLVRDNLAIVQQLGLDPHEVAKEMAKTVKKSELQQSFGMAEPMEGQFFPEKYEAADESLGEWFLELHSQVFHYKMLNKIADCFAENAVMHYIGGDYLVGHDEIQGAFISLLASFPNAAHIVDRITCNEREDGSADVAVRWRLRGLHEGIGTFGPPSGKPVEILAVSQYRVENRRIQESWVVFDAVDVLKQIYAGDEEQAKEE